MPVERERVHPRIADYGSVFCHYTDSETAFEKVVKEGQLRFSPYHRMRDPTEASPWVFGAAYFPDGFAGQEDELETRQLSEAEINELKHQSKLLALTQDALSGYDLAHFHDALFSRGWARARMWQQYGDDHSGVCLVFDRERLIAAMKDGLEAASVSRFYEGPVRYAPSGIAGERGALTLHLNNFKDKPMAEAIGEHLGQHYRELFLLKTLDWDSEHEYRLVAHRADDDYLHVPFGDSLIAIIVGHEFPNDQEPALRAACEAANAVPYRLKWLHEGPFPVEVESDKEVPPAGPE